MTSPCYKQHRTRPCKDRKSGAPAVPERERKKNVGRTGHPPTRLQAEVSSGLLVGVAFGEERENFAIALGGIARRLKDE